MRVRLTLCLGKLFWSFFIILNILNGLENGLENSLTLQILRWYKWLRFKDIVQGFRKLKKKVEKKQNGLEQFVEFKKQNGLEQYEMEWDGWDDFPKHSNMVNS